MVRVLEGLSCVLGGWTDWFVGFGFSSGPIRMVFMLFDALAAKAINFLRNGSGPWRVGLIGLLVLVLVRVLLGWSLCYLDAGREK